MVKKTIKNEKQKKHPKGMGLVEVIVAIGISVITLTSSVVFSTRLSMRAQQTFVEESILQLQSIISEELRLVEQGLKRDVKNNLKFSNGSFLQNDTNVTSPNISWRQFCANTPYNNLNINLPSFASSYSNHTVNMTIASGSAVPIPDEPSTYYIFTQVSGNSKFGSFTEIPVEIALRKTIDSSELGNNITIKSVVRYRLYNKLNYTKPQEIRMIYRLVCPTS